MRYYFGNFSSILWKFLTLLISRLISNISFIRLSSLLSGYPASSSFAPFVLLCCCTSPPLFAMDLDLARINVVEAQNVSSGALTTDWKVRLIWRSFPSTTMKRFELLAEQWQTLGRRLVSLQRRALRWGPRSGSS